MENPVEYIGLAGYPEDENTPPIQDVEDARASLVAPAPKCLEHSFALVAELEWPQLDVDHRPFGWEPSSPNRLTEAVFRIPVAYTLNCVEDLLSRRAFSGFKLCKPGLEICQPTGVSEEDQ